MNDRCLNPSVVCLIGRKLLSAAPSADMVRCDDAISLCQNHLDRVIDSPGYKSRRLIRMLGSNSREWLGMGTIVSKLCEWEPDILAEDLEPEEDE